jgi:hypothetical protein
MLVWNYLLGRTSSLGDKPANPLHSLRGWLVMTLWSLLSAGWITIPAGAVAGYLLRRR